MRFLVKMLDGNEPIYSHYHTQFPLWGSLRHVLS